MYVKPLLGILLFVFIQEASLQDYDYNYEDDVHENPQPLNCSVTESIKDGHVTYSQGGLEGSVLTYHCGPGQYPFPVSSRACGADGQWSAMRLANGRPVSSARCKDVLCPAQLQLDNGDFWPREQWFRVGATQSFSCQEGFTLQGSAERNCTDSGEWTGATPVCDNHADDCSDPGVPPGAQRSAGRFHTGEKVIYQCQAGLDLLGSAERVCLENREWSGSAPRCQGPHSFDSPSRVAAAMAESLAGLMDVLSPDSKKKDEGTTFGRTFQVSEGSRMNVYILLDTSGSIRKEDFELSRDATVALIRKLDSYDVQMNFHVVSFASETKNIVNISDTDTSSSAEDVIWYLMQFDYHSHGRKTGTNLYSALHSVSEEINYLKQNSATNHFNETQNIIIIETDGHSNTGIRPQIALARIRHLLGYKDSLDDHALETMLDIYVFGIGEKVNKKELNSLASKKPSEQHLFILKNYKMLGRVFNSIISDQSVTMCGIAQEVVSKHSAAYTQPWHVALKSSEWGPEKSCFGSIVSPNWVLTAAHCFARESKGRVPTQLDIEYGGGVVMFKRIIMHPAYNINTLKHRNVSEFYEYDVALVQVNSSIPLSWKARPICLPCTVPGSRAMRKLNSTCDEHKKELLAHKETSAFFIHKKSVSQSERKETHIHTENQRPDCVEKARRTLKEPTDVTLDEYVPDTFLCTGGTAGYKDAIACKGDSGGSLFLQKRKRYFQVGVLSWGIMDVCALGYSSNKPPPEARDFHIDLFKIMPWLKKHLGNEIQFLPEIN
ncbi:complement C2 [Stegastes partitus]|uniref:C3/C5 convertase n=1 Tax=Stegastes partitus TaxID=144197 RepID=A0A3B5A9F6_9TELE|nr:PREDICTED: complement C2-like [Stegastes partitus]